MYNKWRLDILWSVSPFNFLLLWITTIEIPLGFCRDYISMKLQRNLHNNNLKGDHGHWVKSYPHLRLRANPKLRYYLELHFKAKETTATYSQVRTQHMRNRNTSKSKQFLHTEGKLLQSSFKSSEEDQQNWDQSCRCTAWNHPNKAHFSHFTSSLFICLACKLYY
jgi:beta-galactosidase/beta-glucuronidase